MAVLVVTHPSYLDHDAGPWHPERPARLEAVLAGIRAAGVEDAVERAAPRAATRAELEAVHHGGLVDGVERLCAAGGGAIDADTVVVPESWDAAVLAAGAGPSAIERLDAAGGALAAAFCAVRPPGHHARPVQAMGFCLFNNVAVAAAALADRGERVLIVDWDAHHGNGTQDCFWDDHRVAFVSMHQYGLGFYPGTGGLHEANATTVNVPFPAGTPGDAYRAAIAEVVEPFAERFRPTWVLVSAGFDGHRADPIASLGLSAGDFADLTERVAALAPPGRRLVFLEGGYDLDALAASAGACVAALAGERVVPEMPTSGTRGRDVVEAVARARLRVDEAAADN